MAEQAQTLLDRENLFFVTFPVSLIVIYALLAATFIKLLCRRRCLSYRVGHCEGRSTYTSLALMLCL